MVPRAIFPGGDSFPSPIRKVYDLDGSAEIFVLNQLSGEPIADAETPTGEVIHVRLMGTRNPGKFRSLTS